MPSTNQSPRMLPLLLLLPLVSAEFLTVVTDGDSSSLPLLCEEQTVISCSLVTLDLASLTEATIQLMGEELAFLDQPGQDTFTFVSEEGAEATFTVDKELGVVWGHAELADGRDFILEPASDSCEGCHVLIEEDLALFPLDHAAPPPPGLLERQSTAWGEKAVSLLAKGVKDKKTVVTYTIKVYYTPEVKKANKDVATMVNNIIATTNQGYINSKIPIRVKLHCLELTAKSEAQGMNSIDTFSEHKGSMAKLRGSADAAALLKLLLIQKNDQWRGLRAAWGPEG